jgi:hypothetical protein
VACGGMKMVSDRSHAGAQRGRRRTVIQRRIPLVSTLHTVAVAALGVAILGTAVNGGGITIWYTVTLAFTVTVSALWVDRTSHLNVIHRAAWHGGSADRLSVS